MKSYDLGIAGEESAAIYLEKHGYEIISRRTRIGYSEIDITARDKRDGTVVFVEVKTRRMNPSGAGFYSTAGSAVDERSRRISFVRRRNICAQTPMKQSE